MTNEFKSFFKAVGGNEGGKCNYATRLDTYGCGCQHNCAYCYARALLDFRGLWNPTSSAVADIGEIRKTIRRELHKGDKILVEFLRVNTWIARWVRETGLPVVLRQYRYKSAGYRHLPLRVKRELMRQITGFRERSVCEDVEEHFAYWQEAVNANINDCCNLRRTI